MSVEDYNRLTEQIQLENRPCEYAKSQQTNIHSTIVIELTVFLTPLSKVDELEFRWDLKDITKNWQARRTRRRRLSPIRREPNEQRCSNH